MNGMQAFAWLFIICCGLAACDALFFWDKDDKTRDETKDDPGAWYDRPHWSDRDE